MDVFRGCCVAHPPSSSHPGDGFGSVQAPLSIALLQGPPLASGAGKVSTGFVALAQMMAEQELRAGGGDTSGLVVLA